MSTAIRVLIVEDCPDDAQLLLRELRRGGYDPIHERVDTAEAMSAALDQAEWEIVIADYSMPQFSALEALSLLRSRGLDLPFLIVSGTISEETAVEALRAGAHDFVTKERLARLVPAIARELREAATRCTRARTEQALRESEERFRTERQRAAEKEAWLQSGWEQERQVVAALQRSFVPQAMPAIAGLSFGHAYRPAAQRERVGGDFYDAVQLDARRVAFCIGDISGKGLDAALAAAMARHMWRGFLIEALGPGRTMERLNDALSRYLAPEQFVTMICGVLDGHTGVLEYSAAGHPPPILRRAGGDCQTLSARGLLLGAVPGHSYVPEAARLGRGDLLLLYTDGLSELRGDGRMLETAGVQEWLHDCPATAPEEVIRLLYERAQRWSGDALHDDVALLAIRRERPVRAARSAAVKKASDRPAA